MAPSRKHPVKTCTTTSFGSTVIESRPGLLSSRRCTDVPRATHATAPRGYALVTEPGHEIGSRDVVFMGGRRAYWQPARRAGEVGSLQRFSSAMSVATPV